jgi:hypothetical protein
MFQYGSISIYTSPRKKAIDQINVPYIRGVLRSTDSYIFIGSSLGLTRKKVGLIFLQQQQQLSIINVIKPPSNQAYRGSYIAPMTKEFVRQIAQIDIFISIR